MITSSQIKYSYSPLLQSANLYNAVRTGPWKTSTNKAPLYFEIYAESFNDLREIAIFSAIYHLSMSSNRLNSFSSLFWRLLHLPENTWFAIVFPALTNPLIADAWSLSWRDIQIILPRAIRGSVNQAVSLSSMMRETVGCLHKLDVWLHRVFNAVYSVFNTVYARFLREYF